MNCQIGTNEIIKVFWHILIRPKLITVFDGLHKQTINRVPILGYG